MNSALLMLLGGSSLLIYSMQELSDSVQYLAGGKFRTWINTFAGNSFSALLLGFLLAVFLSSSGAVTVMLVGLANARLLSMSQVLAVTLGAGVGTTLIVQIIAFQISEYALLVIAIGVGVGALGRSDHAKQISNALLHLGLMFFSMTLLMDAAGGLRENDLFNFIINYFKSRPMVTVCIGTIIAALIHSSAATIALAMSLMASPQWTVFDAIPWVLGANLGTTTTAFLASLRGGPLGKQAALAHLMVKVFGVIVCFPMTHILGVFAMGFATDFARQVAHIHTFFNSAIALLFFPFISAGAKLVQYLVPPKEKSSPFNMRYIDDNSLDSPELAFAQAHREILRLSDLVERMLVACLEPFKNWDDQKVESIREKDQIVDYLNRGIKMYLTKLSQKEMSTTQVAREFELLLRTNDLESIGDIIDGHILSLARKQHKKGYSFSKEGWAEIDAFHAKVIECVRLSSAFFSSDDRKLGAKLMRLDAEIEEMVLDLTEKHLKRLHKGVKESQDTTSIHLDLIGNLQRISTLAINFATMRGNRGS